jgi:hypothetical protein
MHGTHELEKVRSQNENSEVRNPPAYMRTIHS